jgi:hypothetical protein
VQSKEGLSCSFVIAAAALALASTAALADNCTWSTQSDGGQRGICLDDNGKMYGPVLPGRWRGVLGRFLLGVTGRIADLASNRFVGMEAARLCR